MGVRGVLLRSLTLAGRSAGCRNEVKPTWWRCGSRQCRRRQRSWAWASAPASASASACLQESEQFGQRRPRATVLV